MILTRGLRSKSSKQQRTVLVEEYKHILKGTESMLTKEKRKSKRMKTKPASPSYTTSHLMMIQNELYKDYTWRNSTWTLADQTLATDRHDGLTHSEFSGLCLLVTNMSKITAQRRTCNRYSTYRRDGLALCGTRRSARQQDFAVCHFYETELTRKTNFSKNCYFAPEYKILAKMTLRCYKSR
jgi:hypothetical protein